MRKYTAFLFFIALGLTAGPAVDQFGKTHDLKNLDGFAIIDFAASWCKPCWSALPHIQEFANANPDIKVVVISVDDTQEGRDLLVKKLKLTMPVIWDSGHHLAESYDPPGMPTTMILDSSGAVVYSHVGFTPKKWRRLQEKLKQLRSR